MNGSASFGLLVPALVVSCVAPGVLLGQEVRTYEAQLFNAAGHGSTNDLKALLATGNVDVNAQRERDGRTALMLTADLTRLNLLLENGADVNAVDGAGRTALFPRRQNPNTAISVGVYEADMVQSLLLYGADPNIRDVWGIHLTGVN